ncbi:MAG TPA: YlxR family protein [Mycobacteriales bacterium]|nr:YlxR family protein [Mycobacteriales bacterium]
MTGRALPVRTCVGCRERASKSDLLRVVVVGGVLVVDPRGRAPGRGAHLHPDPACLDQAERRRAFVRALRLARPPDVGAVRDHVAGARASGRKAVGGTSTGSGSSS